MLRLLLPLPAKAEALARVLLLLPGWLLLLLLLLLVLQCGLSKTQAPAAAAVVLLSPVGAWQQGLCRLLLLLLGLLLGHSSHWRSSSACRCYCRLRCMKAVASGAASLRLLCLLLVGQQLRRLLRRCPQLALRGGCWDLRRLLLGGVGPSAAGGRIGGPCCPRGSCHGLLHAGWWTPPADCTQRAQQSRAQGLSGQESAGNLITCRLKRCQHAQDSRSEVHPCDAPPRPRPTCRLRPVRHHALPRLLQPRHPSAQHGAGLGREQQDAAPHRRALHHQLCACRHCRVQRWRGAVLHCRHMLHTCGSRSRQVPRVC